MISEYLLWRASDLTIHAGRRAEKSGTVVDMNFDLAKNLHIQTESRVELRGTGSPIK